MTGVSSVDGNRKKGFSANVQAKAQSNTACSFCWFVTTIYPTLNGMTATDDSVFREHLRKAHGLVTGIQP